MLDRMRHRKRVAFDTLLEAASVHTLNSENENLLYQSKNGRMLQKSAAILGLVSPKSNNGYSTLNPDQIAGLDLYEDFVSDANSEDEGKMKKVQYEMDQIVTD